MNTLLLIGVIIFTGFALGELASTIKLPKATGYLAGGFLLNPDMTGFVDKSFLSNTEFPLNLSLSIITFAIGGDLTFSRIRSMGKTILSVAFFEAEITLLFTIGGLIAAFMLLPVLPESLIPVAVPMALVLGTLATPTDPAGTLAVKEEFGAKGPVTSTVLGVAAIDDGLTLIHFALATQIALSIVGGNTSIMHAVGESLAAIGGAVVTGVVLGWLLNFITRLISRESEGMFIVLFVGLVSTCFGIASLLGFDAMLSTMAMGIWVVNFNVQSDKIFGLLERYTEQLIFVLFFVLSAMKLDPGAFSVALGVISIYVFFRFLGKWSGSSLGAISSGASDTVKKYTVWGILPQGGIVIGLALSLPDSFAFKHLVINAVIGGAVIHEIIGPVLTEMALKKAGEIPENSSD